MVKCSWLHLSSSDIFFLPLKLFASIFLFSLGPFCFSYDIIVSHSAFNRIEVDFRQSVFILYSVISRYMFAWMSVDCISYITGYCSDFTEDAGEFVISFKIITVVHGIDATL